MKRHKKLPSNKQVQPRVPVPLGENVDEQVNSTHRADPARSFRHKYWWIFGLFLITFTFLAYQRVWRAGFIWDDDEYVINNLALRSWDGLRQIWFNLTATPQYYPLVHTSFWLEYHLWGLNPLGYHLVNVSLHALAAILLWRVLVRLQLPGAWLAAGIFALHPVCVESVAWVTERKNVLAAVFYFTSALAWLRWTDGEMNGQRQTRGSFLWYFLAFALFLAALLSKTVTASLPAAMLLVIWWKRGRIAGRDVWPLLPLFAAGAVMGLMTSWLERTHVGAQGPAWAFSFPERCLITGRAVWFYAAKLFWPANLTFIYPRWHLNAGVWWQWIFPIAALAVVAVLWSLRQRIGRGPLVAVLFFGGTLFPALGFTNVYPMRYSFVADHFQYLAGIGLLALVSAGIAAGLRRKPLLASTVCAALLLTLGELTWKQCRIYTDAETLWRVTLDRNPDCCLAHNNLGSILLSREQLDEAMVHFKKAVAVEPDYADAYNNLGNVLVQKEDLDGAITQFQRALAIRPGFIEAQNGLGNALLHQGRVDEAILQFQKALAVRSDLAEVQENLGIALIQKGQAEAAIVHFRRALAIQPDNAYFRYNLSNTLLQQGQVDEAIIHLQKALAIQPGLTEAQDSLTRIAWVLATSPDPTVRNGTRAVELAQQADRLSGGGNPVMAATLAAADAEAGRFPEAITNAQRAMQLAAGQNNPALVAGLEAQLKLYQTGSPFHQPAASR